MRYRIGVLLLGAIYLAACSDSNPAAPAGSSAPSPTPTPASGTITLLALTGSPPAVGGTSQFTATAKLTNGTTQDVTGSTTWASSNTAVLTIGSSGLATGVGLGNTNVQATYQSVSGIQLVSVTTSLPGRFAISTTASQGWGSIEVSVNGQSIGTLRKYLEPGGASSCAAIADTRLVATVQPGAVTYSARSDRGTVWNGSQQLGANGCFELTLTCDNRNCAPPPPPPPPPPIPSPSPTGGFFVWGGSNYSQYLGFFTCVFCTEFSSDSINNQFGSYGSQFSSTSIRNQFSQYGSQFSTYSACNQFASNPPKVSNGNLSVYYGELTVNQFRPLGIKTSNIVNWLVGDVCRH